MLPAHSSEDSVCDGAHGNVGNLQICGGTFNAERYSQVPRVFHDTAEQHDKRCCHQILNEEPMFQRLFPCAILGKISVKHSVFSPILHNVSEAQRDTQHFGKIQYLKPFEDVIKSDTELQLVSLFSLFSWKTQG